MKKSSPGPLLVIGADALDLAVLEPLLASGRAPNLARLIRMGAHGTLLSEHEMRSPALWTTIATGRPRSMHRIYDFVTGSSLWPERLRSGRRQLVTSRMRKIPAVWNLASDAGKKVSVVGWLNTWPAEQVNGTMVSPYVALGQRKQITIKGAIYADEQQQIYPADEWSQVRPLIVSPEEVPPELVNRLFGTIKPSVFADIPLLRRYKNAVRWSLAHTLTVKAITLHLLASDRPDLAMAYFEGSDSLAHRFWVFRQPTRTVAKALERAGYAPRHARALKRALGGLVDAYYEVLDETIGELVSALPPNGRVLVLSDHGFTGRSIIAFDPDVPFTGEHRLEGSIILAGDGIPPRSTLYGATLYDITPTLLSMLDLPPLPSSDGHVLTPRVSEGVEEIPTPIESPFRDEELERLRSLGYVQ